MISRSKVPLLHSHPLKYSLVPRLYFKPVRAIKDNFLHLYLKSLLPLKAVLHQGNNWQHVAGNIF
jgi:hypothetical protein